MQLLDTGMTPRQVARAIGTTANAVYNIRHAVAGGPNRQKDVEVPTGPACVRCGLRGAHECLTAASIYWQPRSGR